MINIIVPFSKPVFKNNIIENFKRQTYFDKRLIIIENGKGIGSFKNSEYIILSSGSHQSLAKNEGIDWVKKNGGGWWTTWDCDDYYGPNYLQELSENLDKAEIIGKSDRFLKTENDELVLTSGIMNNIQGPTITALAEECCYFQVIFNPDGTPQSGEDSKFIKDMKDRGARIYSTSKFNFMQCRYKDVEHVWPIYSNEIIQTIIGCGGKAIKFNNLDLDIVNGINKDWKYSNIEKRELRMDEIYLFNKKA
jgi:hypothetical protein